jgi:hypothetical protein
MFDRYELEIIGRALRRMNDNMRSSKYIVASDKHLLKCEALQTKTEKLVKEAPR